MNNPNQNKIEKLDAQMPNVHPSIAQSLQESSSPQKNKRVGLVRKNGAIHFGFVDENDQLKD